MHNPELALLRQAIAGDQLESAAEILGRHPGLLAGVSSEPGRLLAGCFEIVRSRAMVDLLFTHGLSPEGISVAWASGFGLQRVSRDLAEHLVSRGVVLSAHAAAALGWVEYLADLLDRTPALVDAKGGDGCRPLHFARDVATARLLVDRGAGLDPVDDDHASTPAQWRIGDAPEVTRFLLDRGARVDLFMAAGLGDLDLAQRCLREDPACPTYRIGHNRGPFPGVGFQRRGGTIYQWTLGFNQSAQEIAHRRGFIALFDWLMARTPDVSRFLIACMLVDRTQAEAILAANPGLPGRLEAEDQELLAKCCWETNLNREAVRLMLDLGFPVDVPERNHGYLPLHNAAWCGDAGLVQLLLERGHPVDRRDPGYRSTALGYALHSCLVARRHPEGDFPTVIRVLLAAGTPLDAGVYPTGHAGIDAVLREFQTPGA